MQIQDLFTEQQQEQLLRMQYQQLKQKQFFKTFTDSEEDTIIIDSFLQFYFSPFVQHFQPNTGCNRDDLNCFIKYNKDNVSKTLARFEGINVSQSIKKEIKRQYKFADTLSFLELLVLFSYSLNSFAHITAYLSRRFRKQDFYRWLRNRPYRNFNVLLVPFMYFFFLKRLSPVWVRQHGLRDFSQFSCNDFHFEPYRMEIIRHRHNRSALYQIFIRLANDMNIFLETKCANEKFNTFELNILLEIMAELIDQIFVKTPFLRTELQLYRGTDNTTFIQDGSTVNQGIVHFYNTNFSSTAISKSHSEGYVRNNGALLIVTCPIGSKLIFLESFTFYDQEYEFVLPRDTVFHITNQIVKHAHHVRYTEFYMTMLQKEKRPQFVGGQYSVFNYHIGVPISRERAHRYFIHKTIKSDLIHGFQENAIDFDTRMFHNGHQFIPFANCVQLIDGTVISKQAFQTIVNQYTTVWQGKENVGFKNPHLDYIYGNMVSVPLDGYATQKPGTLIITLLNVEAFVSDRLYLIQYVDPNRLSYRVRGDGQPITCYIPQNDMGKILLLFYIEAFKKGNLFRFLEYTDFVRYGGPISLLTKQFYERIGLTPDQFIQRQQEFYKIGIMKETLKNTNFDPMMPDPYPREKQFRIEYQDRTSFAPRPWTQYSPPVDRPRRQQQT